MRRGGEVGAARVLGDVVGLVDVVGSLKVVGMERSVAALGKQRSGLAEKRLSWRGVCV